MPRSRAVRDIAAALVQRARNPGHATDRRVDHAVVRHSGVADKLASRVVVYRAAENKAKQILRRMGETRYSAADVKLDPAAGPGDRQPDAAARKRLVDSSRRPSAPWRRAAARGRPTPPGRRLRRRRRPRPGRARPSRPAPRRRVSPADGGRRPGVSLGVEATPRLDSRTHAGTEYSVRRAAAASSHANPNSRTSRSVPGASFPQRVPRDVRSPRLSGAGDRRVARGAGARGAEEGLDPGGQAVARRLLPAGPAEDPAPSAELRAAPGRPAARPAAEGAMTDAPRDLPDLAAEAAELPDRTVDALYTNSDLVQTVRDPLLPADDTEVGCDAALKALKRARRVTFFPGTDEMPPVLETRRGPRRHRVGPLRPGPRRDHRALRGPRPHPPDAGVHPGAPGPARHQRLSRPRARGRCRSFRVSARPRPRSPLGSHHPRPGRNARSPRSSPRPRGASSPRRRSPGRGNGRAVGLPSFLLDVRLFRSGRLAAHRGVLACLCPWCRASVSDGSSELFAVRAVGGLDFLIESRGLGRRSSRSVRSVSSVRRAGSSARPSGRFAAGGPSAAARLSHRPPAAVSRVRLGCRSVKCALGSPLLARASSRGRRLLSRQRAFFPAAPIRGSPRPPFPQL